MIFSGVRDDGWEKHSKTELAIVSSSHGIGDVDNARMIRRSPRELIAGRDRILQIPASKEEETALERVEAWKDRFRPTDSRFLPGPSWPFGLQNGSGKMGRQTPCLFCG